MSDSGALNVRSGRVQLQPTDVTNTDAELSWSKVKLTIKYMFMYWLYMGHLHEIFKVKASTWSTEGTSFKIWAVFKTCSPSSASSSLQSCSPSITHLMALKLHPTTLPAHSASGLAWLWVHTRTSFQLTVNIKYCIRVFFWFSGELPDLCWSYLDGANQRPL